MKDPKRWQDILIDSPFGKLTKKDIFDYYTDPRIKSHILDAAGSREAIIRQSFSPSDVVLRRKDPEGNLINLSKQYDHLKDIRMTEVHATFGKKTDHLLVDIDPGPKVPWDRVKSMADTIAKTFKSQPEIKKVDVQFSGDRGFYVRGHLEKELGIDKARDRVKEVLHGLTMHPDTTFGKATPNQIRLDTTIFKNRGSVKAPYSLSSRTGLVSAPVKLEDLPKIEKEDFKIENIVKKAAEHILVSGRPGSGKTTYTKDLAEQLGLPVTHVDYVPERLKAFKNMMEAKKTLEETEKKIIRESLAKKDPQIIEGWQLLNAPPELLSPHRRILVDPGKKRTLDQFVSRELGKNPKWDPEDIKTRALSLAAESDTGFKKYKAIPGTEVRRPRKVEKKAEDEFDLARAILGMVDDIPFLYQKILANQQERKKKLGQMPPSMTLNKMGEEEFAPGIPKSRAIEPIPEIKNKAWTLAVQKHDALKAGPHFDFRLVDPKTNQAHSFAIPKAKIPKPGEPMVLAIQQPTHTSDYALHFEGDIPKGTYGAGKVTLPIKEPVQVIKSNADRIHLQRDNGDELVMFRTKGNNWGLKAKEK